MQTFLHISMKVKKKVCQWEMVSDILLPQKMETLKEVFLRHTHTMSKHVRGTRTCQNLRKKESLHVPKTRAS